jgi:hypothetical protein
MCKVEICSHTCIYDLFNDLECKSDLVEVQEVVMITEELFQGNSGSGLENRKLTTVGESLR